MIKVASVFSGIGAPEQALKNIGIKHVNMFACDIDKYCKKVFHANHLVERWYDDVHDIDYSGPLDLIIGGSPCQSFSSLGKRRGFEDERGNLFLTYLKLIAKIKPKYFVWENVLGSVRGSNKDVVYSAFDSILQNYKVVSCVMSPHTHANIPQSRRRVFFVGSTDCDFSFKFPENIPLTKTVIDDILMPVANLKHLKDRSNHRINSSFGGAKVIFDMPVHRCLTTMGFFYERGSVTSYYTYEDKLRCLNITERKRLMGFHDEFIMESLASDTQCLKMLGNSICVGVIEKLFINLFKKNLAP